MPNPKRRHSKARRPLHMISAGSNVMGAMCGIAALVAFPAAPARWIVLAVLVGFNLLSEAVSFSAVIDAVAPLRWFDRLGSQRR